MTVITMSRYELTRLRVLIDIAERTLIYCRCHGTALSRQLY